MGATYLLLDGHNLAFRAYYAIKGLTRHDGFPTGAVHGWLRSVWKLEDMVGRQARTIAFFDHGGAVAREALHADYKANRVDTPEELLAQLPIIRELTLALGIALVEREGIEADDLIGSASQLLAARGDNVWIVSADKDLAQCLRERVGQILPAPTANPKIGWRYLEIEGVPEKFGVAAAQIPDYLALIGDTSDNIPGIPGVGPKTAAKWLRDYGSLEVVLRNAAYLQPKRFQPVIRESEELLRRNLQLTRLELDEDFEEPPSPEFDLGRVIEILESMEMRRAAADARKRYQDLT